MELRAVKNGLNALDRENYHVALAFSNLQENFEVPAVVSAIVARDDSVSQLKNMNVPKKPRKSTLSDMRAIFEDVEPLLYDTKTVELPENSWDPSAIGTAYISILDTLLGNLFDNNLLRYVATVKTITFRNGVVTRSFDYAFLPSHIQEQLRKRGEIVRPLDDKSNDVLLKIAQNLAMQSSLHCRKDQQESLSLFSSAKNDLSRSAA